MSLLLTMSVYVNFFAFFATDISTMTLVTFSSFTHVSCSITSFVLFFANFMHACIICVDLGCRIVEFEYSTCLQSFCICIVLQHFECDTHYNFVTR